MRPELRFGLRALLANQNLAQPVRKCLARPRNVMMDSHVDHEAAGTPDLTGETAEVIA